MFELTGTDIEAFGALFAQASHAHLAVRLTNQHLQGCCGPYFLARGGCGPRVSATVVMEARKPDRTARNDRLRLHFSGWSAIPLK